MNWWNRILSALPLIIAVALISHKRLTRVFPRFSDQQSSSDQSSNISQGNNPCPQHLPFGTPTGTPATNDVVCRESYSLSSNDETKFPDWVAYTVLDKNLKCKVKQTRDWEADPDIDPSETLEPEDYKGAHQALRVDRGHFAPLASFKCVNWKETNYLSNISPQNSDLNRGVWKDLEDRERDLARQYGTVHVLTGPVYERDMPSLPGADEPHKVPSGYWKIVFANGESTAYFFEQYTNATKVEDGIVDSSFIESITGLSFMGRIKNDRGN